MIDTEILKQGTETIVQIGGMSIQGVLIVSFLFMLVGGALMVFFLIRHMMKSTTNRIESLEQDKDNIREYALQTKASNDALIKSNNELKKDRKLLHEEIEKLTIEVKNLREDYRKCLENKENKK